MRRLLALLALSGCASEDAAPHQRSGQCTPCHLQDFQTAPGHVGERPTTCAVCHGQDAWVPSILDHRWPLVGAHAKAGCFDCHEGEQPVFEGKSQQCFDCHAQDFAHAIDLNPWHAPFSHECTKCHTNDAWKPTLPHEAPPPPVTAPPPEPPPPPPEPTATASTPKPVPRWRPPPPKLPPPPPKHPPPPQPPPDPDPDINTHASGRHK
jgi:hypothetical protein